ncbi:MAG: FkbM family methyltransferase [Pseudomonadota bacterium]
MSRIKTRPDYLRGYDLKPDVVFDVGVMDGTPYLYDAFAQAKFALIDPLVESREIIAAQGLSIDYDFHTLAVGAEPGELALNIPTTQPGKGADMASFLDRRDGIEAEFSSVEARKVEVSTLDTLASGYTGRFGLKIDTEGFELSVLQGATEMLKSCEFVILEMSVTQRFAGVAPPSKVITLLAAAGLELRDVLAVAPQPHRPMPPRHMDLLFTRWA